MLLRDQGIVPADLFVRQGTHSVGLHASIPSLSAVRPDECLVTNHLVAPVQGIDLGVDQIKAVLEVGGCCLVARLGQFTQSPILLMLQAFAEVFEIFVGPDLKTSQVWGGGGRGSPRASPSPWLEFDQDRLEPESSSNQAG